MRVFTSYLVVCLAVVSLPLLLAGCPGKVTNQPPVANAGPDQTVQAGAAVTLDGTGSADPDGDTLTFAWTQTAGTAVTLTGPDSASPTFAAPTTAGTLTFELTVSDGKASATDTVDVSVGGANQPPIANAGPNQSVQAGDTVTLNGTGSSDPDGDTITYAWTQVPDTVAVTLNGANTATPTFTAPSFTGTLTFQLTVSDGQASATDTVDIGVGTTVAATPLLFIANYLGSNVTAYDISNVNNVNGNVAPSANLAGAQTQLFGPSDLVITADGSLLVTNSVTRSVTTYLNAHDLAGINGNVAPARNVQGAATTLGNPASLAIRGSSDLLFVADYNTARILVFAAASTSGFNGNLAPIRVFTSTDMTGPIGINFGAGDTLYVANFLDKKVAVFDNASTLNGAVAASRVISSTAFSFLYDVFIDVANDRMFLVDLDHSQIHVLGNASTRNGAVMPDVILTIPGAMQLNRVAVDSKGVGYITDFLKSTIYSYDNIATRNGTIAPDRTLQGSNTQLSRPDGMFLLEQ